MGSGNKITLREIAAKTGVTRMAVSLALRGKPGVSKETRRKVMRAAEQLGYEPDPEVAKLMSHIRSKLPDDTRACLALLTSGKTAEDWKRFATERKYVEGAMQRAKEYGYRIEVFWLNEPGMSPSRLGNIIWNRGIEGVIVAPLQGKLSKKEPRSIHLDFSPFSVVEISETVESPDLDRSIHDQYTSMLKLLDELSGLNYRAIGLVMEDALDLRVNGKWTAAFLQYRHRRGKKMPPPLLMSNADQIKFNTWFDRYAPDVVIGVAHFGLELLQNRGSDIPGEVGYASLDIDGDSKLFPDVSGIDQNSHLVGAAAVDMLVASIQRGQKGIPAQPVRMEIEGTWREGKSTLPQSA
ncbi:MAG: LacI family transcriptional regulator [Verrucomicrobia bacterium]|nr:LacI family transcriptional regulator [Verrucomicrobiota bacterium]